MNIAWEFSYILKILQECGFNSHAGMNLTLHNETPMDGHLQDKGNG